MTAERWHGPGPAFPVIREFAYNYTANPFNIGRLDSITEGGNTWTFQGGTQRPSKVTFDYAGQASFELTYMWSSASPNYPSRISLFDDDDIFEDGRIETDFVGGLPFNFEWTTPDGDGRHIRYFYDAMARIDRIERFDTAFTSTFADPPFATTRYSYDESYRVDEIRHEDSGGSLLFPESLLQYDRTPGGMINSITQPTDTAVYSYDSIGQVTGATHSNVAYPNESYTYDAAGNRTMSHLFARHHHDRDGQPALPGRRPRPHLGTPKGTSPLRPTRAPATCASSSTTTATSSCGSTKLPAAWEPPPPPSSSTTTPAGS